MAAVGEVTLSLPLPAVMRDDAARPRALPASAGRSGDLTWMGGKGMKICVKSSSGSKTNILPSVLAGPLIARSEGTFKID